MSLGKFVAIVDDEIDITELFQDALSSYVSGISVVSFNDPTVALEHFTKNKRNYALIISDLRMPAMNGIDLLQKVKKLNPKVRTLLISAFALQDNSEVQKYLTEGIIDSFFEKPIKVSRLCQIVEDEVKGYRLASVKQ